MTTTAPSPSRQRLSLLGLHLTLAAVLMGAVLFQVTVLNWFSSQDLGADVASERSRFGLGSVLGLLTIEVITACVWRLAIMARRETLRYDNAFRYVDTVIAALGAAVAVALWLAILLSTDRRGSYLVALFAGAVVLAVALVLVAFVLRRMFMGAVERERQADSLQAVLDAVI